MLFPDVPADYWARRYGLEPFEQPCEHCGAVQKTTIPWAAGNWRGLKSTVCECGKGCDIGVAMQIDLSERRQWRDLYQKIVRSFG